MDARYGTYQAPFQQPGSVPWQLNQTGYESVSSILQAPVLLPINAAYNPDPFAFSLPQQPANMSIEVLPMLPQPAQILKSQDSGTQCVVCARFGCCLISHKHFAEAVKGAKPPIKTVISAGITPKLESAKISVTPKAAQNPTSAVRFPIMMDTEQTSFLAMWSHPFGHTQRGPERHLFPSKFIDAVLPSAMKHAPLFQALLAMASSLCALAEGHIDEACYRYQTFAARVLSQACSDEISASTDECILAALLIMLNYMLQANPAEADRHMSGINHLVLLRGGPHYLGISGIVAETLLYADYMHAVFFDRPLSWEMPLPALEVGPTTNLGRGFDKAASNNDIDPEIAQAARCLCKLTELFNEASGGRAKSKDIHAAGYLAAVSEYQLTRCNSVYHGTSGKNECVCLALLLYNHAVLRDHGSITPFVSKIEYQLWTCLQSSEGLGVWTAGSRELLFWVVLTGITTEFRSDCKWKLQAIEKLRRTRKALRLNTWDDVKLRVLDEFCWLNSAQGETFRSFWVDQVATGS